MQKTTYSCSQCGGRSVHVGRWVNPNTGEQGEDLFDHPVSFATAFWCDDCGGERALNVEQADDPTDELIEQKVFVELDDDDRTVCRKAPGRGGGSN